MFILTGFASLKAKITVLLFLKCEFQNASKRISLKKLEKWLKAGAAKIKSQPVKKQWRYPKTSFDPWIIIFCTTSWTTPALISGAAISRVQTSARRRRARPWTARNAGRASGASADTASPWRRGEPTRTVWNTILGQEVGVRGQAGATVLELAGLGFSSGPGSATIHVQRTVELLA